jgi:hypothetical protein
LRRPWWRSFQGRGALEPREFFAGVLAADSKIQVKSPSSIWRARKYAIVSEKCARLRGKEWRRGRSRGHRCSPETGGAFWQYWRRGDLWLGKPGGVLARVLERGECGWRGGLYGGHCVAEGLGFEPNHRSLWRSRSVVRRVRSGLFGRDDKWDPEVSDRRRGNRYRFGGGRKWAAPFPFSYSFPFSYCWFYLKTLQMKPYLIQTNFELCKIQISLCCLSKGKDFVSEKVKTFGTQMHTIKKIRMHVHKVML